MTSRPFPDQLDDAAETIAIMDRADLAALLRRAAIRLRNHDNVVFDPDVEEVLKEIATYYDVTKMEFVRRIVRQALEAMGNLPVHDLDEDSETRGSA